MKSNYITHNLAEAEACAKNYDGTIFICHASGGETYYRVEYYVD